MKNEFIPYEQALELKELGFDEPCLSSWMGNDYIVQYQKRHKEDDTYLPAPLYQQAFRWFREKYWLFGSVGVFGFEIIDLRKNLEIFDSTPIYYSYEDVQLECLKKLIEIVKTK